VTDVLTTLPAAREWLAKNPPKKGENHAQRVAAILHALELQSHQVACTWTSFTGPEGWHRVAHRNDLRFPRQIDAEFSDRLDLFCRVLAVVLDAAEANYIGAISALDGILGKPTPSREDLKLLGPHLAPGVTALTFVFSRLSVGWLLPLRESAAFSDPPEVVESHDGSVIHPTWPQGGYLERIAGEDPANVAATIEAIPTVNNENVHWCVVRAALKMPPREAARVAAHELSWLGSRPWLGHALPHVVEKLATHLATGGEFDAAKRLLGTALAFAAESKVDLPRRSETRVSSWDYNQIVQHGLHALAEHAPDVAKALLFELLDSCQANSAYAWRPAIEDHRHNLLPTPFDSLLTELRDLYETLVSDREPALRHAVAELESRQGMIYARLALHLLRKYGVIARDLVVERATAQERLDSSEQFHELAEMIRERFSDLTQVEQQKVLTALRINSSPEHLRSLLGYPEGADDDLVQPHVRSRRRKLFALLGSALPADARSEYESLCAEEGEPKQPTFPFSSGLVRTGPNPPIRAAELLALSDTDLVTYLRSWVPSGADPFEPSPDGLGLEVKACAKASPTRFSSLATAFQGLRPEYIAAVFWGLHEFVTSGAVEGSQETIDWDSVVALASHAAGQADIVNDDGYGAWTWPRRMAVDAVEDAAHAAINGDIARVRRAWRVLRVLLDDADPTNTRVASAGADPVTFAANTVRGQALDATINLATALGQVSSDDSATLGAELRLEIAKRADPGAEQSAAIRSVLARHFNHLYLLDAALAAALAPLLFPTTTAMSTERSMVWDTFLQWNEPSKATFEILFDNYSVAVDSAAGREGKAASQLGEHLVVLAVRGVIGPDSGNNLLQRFVENAPTSVRREALNHLGRGLYNEAGPLPPDLLACALTLWAWWEQSVLRRGDARDLAAFGWWVAAAHFDASWLLSTLARVLDMTNGELDWDHEVAEKFVELAPTMPSEVATCLQRFIETSPDHRIYQCLGALQNALTILSSGPTSAASTTMTSRLVARGFAEFRNPTGQ
jgi:hypothetical protein